MIDGIRMRCVDLDLCPKKGVQVLSERVDADATSTAAGAKSRFREVSVCFLFLHPTEGFVEADDFMELVEHVFLAQGN